MTLATALGLSRPRKDPSSTRSIFLVCGFQPLHLPTFLQAHFAQRFPEQALDVQTGLYGDLEGNLAIAAASSCEAAAVLLEWSDIDSRLGLRSTGGWSLSIQPDILSSSRDRFERLLQGLSTLASKMPVTLGAPTLPIPLLGHSAGRQITANELELQLQLSAFLLKAAGILRVSILNPTRLDQLSPPSARLDAGMELKAGFPYSLGHASMLASQVIETLFAATPFKGLVTDLDDTFWSGLVGEVGSSGVSWSLADHAQVHGLYQQLLRHFSEMGVLLAIASKNELATVQQTLQREDLLIPATAFYPVHADWGAKSRHIASILRTWNVGPESVVFVDDSPMELDEVRTAFPGITCLRFEKKNPGAVLTLLERLRDLFGKPAIQREDALRQASLQASEAFREAAQSASGTEFVRALNGRVLFDLRKNISNQRPLELINKTNQFNLNGKRISEGEWLRHLDDPASFVLSVSYQDKFGPLGVIGVVMGKKAGSGLNVSAWVLSCRAFSRRIEFHTLDFLFRNFAVDHISLAYQPTERNQPLQEFLRCLNLPSTGNHELSKDDFVSAAPDLPHEISEIDQPALAGTGKN